VLVNPCFSRDPFAEVIHHTALYGKGILLSTGFTKEMIDGFFRDREGRLILIYEIKKN